jgi:hypothetical protein
MLGTNKHIVGGTVLPTPVTVSNSNRIYYAPSYSDVYQLNGYLTFDRHSENIAFQH